MPAALAQDPDLPGYPEDPQLIGAGDGTGGALVIPMDVTNQSQSGLFNLKAYGAVNWLLQHEIPVIWVMKHDKLKAVGSATSANGAGTQLTDTNATFTTDGGDGIVEVGDIVSNVGDEGSWGVVTAVNSATVLTITALTGGKDDDWDSGDAYVIDKNDFEVSAQRKLPTDAGSATSTKFAGGPFIVPASRAAEALTLLASFESGSSGVKVFQTAADVTVDVRYTLTHKPFVAISNVNTKIHAVIMYAAGIPGPNREGRQNRCRRQGLDQLHSSRRER